MIPGRYNIVCSQGSTYSQQFTYSIDDIPVNLTGYTARMQVREKHTSATTIVSLTTENGGITLGGDEGTIDVYIAPGVTETFVAKEYVYDLELVTGSNVYRIIEGKFIVSPEVTR
jgi:molybdopterin-binding protein